MLATKVNLSKTSTKDPEIIEGWLHSGKNITVTSSNGDHRIWMKYGVVWYEDRCSVASPIYDGRCKNSDIIEIPFDEFMERWVYKDKFEFSLID